MILVKLDWKIAMALIAIGVFVFEYVYMFQANQQQIATANATTLETVQGLIEAKATLVEYSPYLIIDTLNASDEQKIRALEGVRSVTHSGQGVIVEPKPGYELSQISKGINALGYRCSSKATFEIGNSIAVISEDGTRTEMETKGGVAWQKLEPSIKTGTQMTVRFTGTVKNKQVTPQSDFQIITDLWQGLMNATVVSLDSVRITYVIPWDSRAEIPAMQEGYGDKITKAATADYIRFASNLTQDAIAGSRFPYIETIESGYAQVTAGYTNKTQIEADFAQYGVLFPNSEVVSTEPLENITYPNSKTNVYTLELEDARLLDSEKKQTLSTEQEFSPGQNMTVEVSAQELGGSLVKVIRIMTE
ncbi:MAG: hypothetical protein ACP5NX_02555 [Candidatus Bilamarchaeaceae archaeon]